MKKIRFLLLAFLVIISGVIFTAFSTHKKNHGVKKHPTTLFYYKYNLTTASGENTPSNYTFISPQPPDDEHVEDCGGSQLPCVIHAQGTMMAPNASEITSGNLPNVTLTQKDSQ